MSAWRDPLGHYNRLPSRRCRYNNLRTFDSFASTRNEFDINIASLLHVAHELECSIASAPVRNYPFGVAYFDQGL